MAQLGKARKDIEISVTSPLPLSDIEAALPLLAGTGYSEESEATDIYNCIAFAFGDTQNWWWPIKRHGMYWPPGFQFSDSPDVLVSIFELHGYLKCDDEQHELGYEKVAIFCVNGRIKHAARQLKSGRWASKLGEAQDIEHEKAEHVVSSSYGEITHFLRKKRGDWT